MRITGNCVQISWHLPYGLGNPEKTQIVDHLMTTMRLVIDSNGVPYLQMTSVGSQRTSGIEKDDIIKG